MDEEVPTQPFIYKLIMAKAVNGGSFLRLSSCWLLLISKLCPYELSFSWQPTDITSSFSILFSLGAPIIKVTKGKTCAPEIIRSVNEKVIIWNYIAREFIGFNVLFHLLHSCDLNLQKPLLLEDQRIFSLSFSISFTLFLNFLLIR